MDGQTDGPWRDGEIDILLKRLEIETESMKEIVMKYMLSFRAQDETSVSYQTVKKAMSNLIKVQYYESKFL